MKKQDPLFTNKIAAAFLSAVLFIMLLDMGVGFLSARPSLEADVYQPVDVENAVAENQSTDSGAATKVAALDTLVFFASANADKGKRVIKKCLACHVFDEGGANKVGPNLYGIINRDIASVEGFNYSSALKNYAAEKKQWALHELIRFLRKPKAEVKGTSMGFAGLKDKDIANLLAYLNQVYSRTAIDLTQ